MILDTIENAERYWGVHEGFAKAFEFLRRMDLFALSPGRHEIEGERVYAMVAEGRGKRREEALLEAHTRYADVQYLLAGREEIGWKSRGACEESAQPYDAGKDIEFFRDRPEWWALLRAGEFAIFFPEDAHAPMVSVGEVRKVVVKVRLC